jgi:hypothetical protein
MTKKSLFMTVVACLLLATPMYAQKKTTKKKKVTSQLVTYPQRDDAFKADFKLTAIGKFDANNVQNMTFTKMPTPYFTGHVLKRDMSRKQVRLTQVSCRQNQITDDEDWVRNNDLTLREERVETPMNQFGPRFRYRTGGYLITTYGVHWGYTGLVVITDEAQETLYAAYDFENFKFSPKTTLMGNYQSVNDFFIEGNILYIAHGSNGYSDGAGYQTGYITAFDMENGEIIWTTQPMTCNSHFAIVNNSIICGYGFTGEPDNLFVLDKYSGQRVQKIPVKKMVNEVVPKDGLAYVRTYSFDYVFKIQ